MLHHCIYKKTDSIILWKGVQRKRDSWFTDRDYQDCSGLNAYTLDQGGKKAVVLYKSIFPNCSEQTPEPLVQCQRRVELLATGSVLRIHVKLTAHMYP